jgi:hypothetical protein
MYFELSKKDKKSAREIIEKGLQKEYTKGLFQFDSIINKWKDNILNNREAYLQLCKELINYDKHIARRYDDMKGSKYLFIIAAQLMDNIISENDLGNFSDETKQAIKLITNL